MRRHLSSILPAVAALVGAVLLTASAGAAGAAAAPPCWQRVIADWADNGTIEGPYAASCYRQAMANAPTDLRIYSTIEDDLRLALQSRTLRRISVDSLRRPAVHVATIRPAGASTSPMVAALGAGLGILGAAISAAVVIGRRRRRVRS